MRKGAREPHVAVFSVHFCVFVAIHSPVLFRQNKPNKYFQMNLIFSVLLLFLFWNDLLIRLCSDTCSNTSAKKKTQHQIRSEINGFIRHASEFERAEEKKSIAEWILQRVRQCTSPAHFQRSPHNHNHNETKKKAVPPRLNAPQGMIVSLRTQEGSPFIE